MPLQKWKDGVLKKLQNAINETGELPGNSIRVPLSGYEITQIIQLIEPTKENLELFRFHDYEKHENGNGRPVSRK